MKIKIKNWKLIHKMKMIKGKTSLNALCVNYYSEKNKNNILYRMPQWDRRKRKRHNVF